MIALYRHIETLLLEHNCVIVPNLGGFIAQDIPARYVPEENIFLPPHRTVAFNPELNINDGLLVQSYMQTYDTNYPETIKLIEEEVEELKSTIQEKGEVELNGIGTIILNIEGVYEFEPNEAGILSPSHYGLDAVCVPTINKQKEEKTKNFIVSTVNDSRNGKNYTINVNKELVHYVAAAVISIFFYFIWATPITDSTSLNIQQASMLFPHNIQRIEEKVPVVSIPIDSIADPNINTAPNANVTPTETKVIDLCEKATPKETFSIVLLSCVPQKNAEKYVERLTQEGLNEVSILKKRNIIRVVQGCYHSESEAYDQLRQLRNKNKEFKDAWILNVR